MAENNEIIFSVGFDPEKLKAQLKKFSRDFKAALRDSLEGFTVNLNNVKTVGKVKVDLTLDLSSAKQQIKDFQDSLLTNPIKLGVVAVQPQKPASGIQPGGISINQGEIDRTSVGIKRIQDDLRKMGLSEVEVGKQTGVLETRLRAFQKVLSDIQREREAMQRSTGSAILPNLTDNQIVRLNKASIGLEELNGEVHNFSKNSAVMRTDLAHTENFMKSFGFRVGILGFSLSIFGGQLRRLSQFMTQFATDSAKATEPLERMNNLITQLVQEGKIDPNDKSHVLNRINQLADLPGSNLDSVAQSFRQLNSLGLEISDTLSLIEGLTKAAARTGTGGQGVERLTEQLRQFSTSGQLTQRDVRTISEQGGTPVLGALEKAFGTTNAETLQAAGPDRVIKAIIAGLKELPAPLETTSDKLNRINNSFIRIRENINLIIRPGLDTLLSGMNKLENAAASLAAQFQKLSPGMKEFIGTLIVELPIIAGVLATILATLGTLAIAVAGAKQLWDGYRIAMAFVAKAAGEASTNISLMAIATSKLSSVFAPFLRMLGVAKTEFAQILFFARAGTTSIRAFSGGIGAAIQLIVGGGLGVALGVIQESISVIGVGLLRILGLTNPIGIALNILLAYATNLGKARDNINAAFKNVFTELGKLISTISGFFTGPVGNAILNFLSTLVELLGGVLGDAVAALIQSFANLLSLVNQFFGLFTNFSLDSLKAFGDTLVRVLSGGMVDLGKLLAASFLDAIADNLPSTKLPIFTPGGTQIPLSGLPTGLHQQATKLREEVFGQGAKSSKEVSDNLANADNNADLLAKSLTKSNEVLDDLANSLDDIGTKLAKINADLRINALRFSAEQSMRNARTEFERLIKADPLAAQRQLPSFGAGIQRTQISGIQTETQEQLREALAGFNRTQGTVNATALPVAQGAQPLGGQGLLNNFKDSFGIIVSLIKQGHTALEDYKDPLKTLEDTGTKLVDSFRGLTMTDQEATDFNTFKKTIDDVKTSATALEDILGKRSADIQKAEQDRITAQQDFGKTIRDNILALQAEDRAFPLKKQLELLQQRLDTQKELLETEGVTEERLNGIHILEQAIAGVQADIAKTSMTEADALQSQKNSHEATLALLRLENEALVQMRQLAAGITQEFQGARKNIEDALKGLRDAQQTRLANISGFAPTVGNTEAERLRGAIGTSRNARLRDELSEFRRTLPETGTVARDNVGTQVQQAIGSLTTFEGNFENIVRKLLTFLGDTSETVAGELRNLDPLIKAQTSITTDATRSDADRQAAANALKVLLDRQKEFLAVAQNISKTDKIISDITADRAAILADELHRRQEITQELVNQLRVQQNLLDLQSQIESTQRDTAAKRRVAPGGGPTGVLDVGAASRDVEAAAKAEEAALRRRTAIRIQELELQRIQLELELRMAGATEQQVKDALALIDLEIQLVGKLTDAQVDNLSASAAVDSINSFKTALEDLYDTLSNQSLTDFADALKSATDDITGNFDILKSSAVLFKDVFATAFIGAFQAIGQAWVDFLTNGESFARGFKKFLGDMLISLGTALIQMSLAAVAMAFMQGLFSGGLAGAFAEVAAVAPMAAVGVAVGTGLVIAGTLLGGGGGAKATTNTNAANTASTKTGASGDDNFDPSKDPRTIYQKALMAQIQIDVRTDDAAIVKTVIKHVNNNGRLTTLIGNRKLNFGY